MASDVFSEDEIEAKMDELEGRLRDELGVPLGALSLESGLRSFLSFYEETEVVGVAECDGDMLLFQWGLYDWTGLGAKLEVDITRQFRFPEGALDFALWQLRLTYSFEPTADAKDLGRGERWYGSHEAFADFSKYVMGADVVSSQGSWKPAGVIVTSDWV